MTGYLIATGPCFACGNLFSFNPDRVPSIVFEGERRQLRRACVEIANPLREEQGLTPIVIYPDSYGPAEG